MSDESPDQQMDFHRPLESSAFRLDESGPYLRLHFVSVGVGDQERSLRFFVDKLASAAFLHVTDQWIISSLSRARW